MQREYTRILIRYALFATKYGDVKDIEKARLLELPTQDYSRQISGSKELRDGMRDYFGRLLRQVVTSFELKMLNELVLPTLFSAACQSPATSPDEVSLLEVVCANNADFVDLLLTFAWPQNMQSLS